ncbi:SPFH domain-containing protein [Thorsellia anophelis]|uniref:SPFH domain / Band 7 family protein n=1 Tax=Thorsellia anophelis DSM 18579 TaxID=1123402 RepID=A0A1I0BHX9_9GAMM|nr:SPFH domain-containing protein [Thorsellia anophelis]SET06200.1 SPFH domain / Band 7 family protein [Thorsellia anophelis DSM 18579]
MSQVSSFFTPKRIILAIGIVSIAGIAKSSVLMTDAGYTYIYQNNITGTLDVFSEPGIHFRMPFLSKITRYDQVVTVSFGNNQGEAFYQRLEALPVRFADTYTGTVPATFRFRLSHDPKEITTMHREFRSNDNLIESMLIKNARNVTVITATQYTGEEFFQGGLNQFKAQLSDQLINGIYSTERRQVEIDQVDLVPVGLDQDDSNKLQPTKQLVWKTVPIENEQGQPIRQDNPLKQYGITVTQVTIGDPAPEEQLDKLLTDKKKLVAERIRAIQEQETSKAQAKTEQLRKEIQRTREVQDAQRTKELAVISQQKDVEVARQIAERELVEERKKKDIATLTKAKELEISKANLEIQKANALSSEYEAKAIREKGIAEADVLSAKYGALGQHENVYLAELNRDVAKQLYENLPNFKISMPQNYINGSNGNLTSNLDVITGLSALGIMEKTQELKASKDNE